MRVLVDTNVLIDYTKGVVGLFLDLKKDIESSKAEAVICPVNVAEFLNDKYLLDNPKKLAEARRFLRLFGVVDIDSGVGEEAGRLLRFGVVGYLGDALIAATCLHYDLVLLTRNKKHFEKVKGLKFYTVGSGQTLRRSLS